MLYKHRFSQPDHRTPALAGRRVLVVEDDPVVAIEYLFQLKDLGAAREFKSSNREALLYLARNEIDAAIVDYYLRDGGCTPLLECLTARQIPFIVVSGDTFAMRDVLINASVLAKPVRATDLRRALLEVLH
jgi:CheY-like chemotaxis protein